MYIAMNRFKITRGREEDFEEIWRARESYLDEVEGFIEFHLLKGPEHEDHTLYATHASWVDRQAFEDWTKSEAFRKAHVKARSQKTEGIYLGPPNFEGFEVVLKEK